MTYILDMGSYLRIPQKKVERMLLKKYQKMDLIKT
jgi:hypothetical protein